MSGFPGSDRTFLLNSRPRRRSAPPSSDSHFVFRARFAAMALLAAADVARRLRKPAVFRTARPAPRVRSRGEARLDPCQFQDVLRGLRLTPDSGPAPDEAARVEACPCGGMVEA